MNKLEMFRQLAIDIKEESYCRQDLSENLKIAILTRMLIDLYWEGWHDNAKGEHYEF